MLDEMGGCYGPLLSLADAAPVPIKVLDRTLGVVIWNQAAQSTYGWTREEMLGQRPPFRGFLPDTLREQWEVLVKRSMTRGDPVRRVLSQRGRRDGTMADVAVSMMPMHGNSGATIGVIATDIDVAERSRFVEIAAHELRGPVASVKAALSYIRRRQAAGRTLDNQSSVLETIAQEIDRLAVMLDEVLGGFRAAAVQLDVALAPVDLNAILTAALKPFQAVQGAHHFVLKDSGRQAVWVRGDARRLEQVVRNLLSNARKYSPNGGEIRVGVEVGAQRVQVTVRDSGIGIPDDELSSIFLPFHRSPVLAGPDPGGAGLGLYLCSTMIAQHGGRIWAENNPDGGAAIHFELPLAADEAAWT